MTERIPVLSELLRPLVRRVREESGIGIIEVVVSALLLAVISVGLFAALDAATRSTAQERHRTQAASIAQADEARLRGLPLSTLTGLSQTRTVTQDTNIYTVASAAKFVADTSGSASCSSGSGADYIQTTSTVSWSSIGSRPPVVAQSIVAPAGDATSASRGGLAVTVSNGQGAGVQGVGISLSGAGSGSGTTDSAGCVLLGDLPAGNYTLTPSAGSRVDKDGKTPASLPTSVIAGATNTLALQYDLPGSVPVAFKTSVGGVLQNSSADQVVVFNTGMTTARVYGTFGTPRTTVTATPLFPFASPDTVYAGSCTGDLPGGGGGAAMAGVSVPAGGSAAPVTLQLPALVLGVYGGTDKTAPVNNAHVTLTDRNCAGAKRTLATNATGGLPDPGVPWSSYDICVDNGTKLLTTANQAVTNMSSGTKLDFFLGSSGAIAGTCP